MLKNITHLSYNYYIIIVYIVYIYSIKHISSYQSSRSLLLLLLSLGAWRIPKSWMTMGFLAVGYLGDGMGAYKPSKRCVRL